MLCSSPVRGVTLTDPTPLGLCRLGLLLRGFRLERSLPPPSDMTTVVTGQVLLAGPSPSHDLVWDSTRSLLYVAVLATDPAFPNTIAVIDPTKPAINQMVPIADGPSAISLSDDGQFLYSGFFGQAILCWHA